RRSSDLSKAARATSTLMERNEIDDFMTGFLSAAPWERHVRLAQRARFRVAASRPGARPPPSSQLLQILDQRVLVVRREIGAVLVPAVAVAGLRGVEQPAGILGHAPFLHRHDRAAGRRRRLDEGASLRD